MVKIDNDSDLEIEVIFRDMDCEEQPVPHHSFIFEWYTDYRTKVITASYDADTGEYANCKIDKEGRLVAYFDDPQLGDGRIKSKKTYFIPDPDFPDRIRKVTFKNNTNFWIGDSGFWKKTRILKVQDSNICYSDIPYFDVPVIIDYAPVLWYWQYIVMSDGLYLCDSQGQPILARLK